MKRLLLAVVALLCWQIGFAQRQMTTYKYAEKDGQELYMDVYTPDVVTDSTISVVYIFGGGFIGGERNNEYGKRYCSMLADNGFVAIAIDYRLGLKGAKNVGLLNYHPVENAIHMATEDAISALDFMIRNSEIIHVNPNLIVLVGSSAGAITALQTDYSLCNGFLNAEILPEDFRLAGVVSYSGAIFSNEGKIKYRKHNPAPTMLFHGTADRLVTYKQLRLFCVGFYGSSKIAPRLEKYESPFYFRHYEDHGHSVAMLFIKTFDDFNWFVRHFVRNRETLQVEENYSNLDKSSLPIYDRFTPDDLYK